jgi:hypothetical protein
LSANFFALYRLLDVDINPYISMNTPAYRDLKSRIFKRAPRYNYIAGWWRFHYFTDYW